MVRLEKELDFFGRPVAEHVPPELVRRIDIFDAPGSEQDPFEVVRNIRDEPPLIYNLHNPFKGQCWLPTRASLVREVGNNPELFSNVNQLGFSALIGETWRYGPLEMDPPEHTDFRRLIGPWLSRPEVSKMADRIRTRAIELIDTVVDKGGCEFMSSFGTIYPVSIFMELMGLPKDQMSRFLVWVGQLLHTGNPEHQAEGARNISAYLRTLLEERRQQPTDDFASRIVMAQINDKPLSDDDVLGLSYLLFTGGLDTVAASLGFFFHHLAAYPEHQERLRRDPAAISKAVDECLRAYSPSQALRQAKADTEIAGIKIKRGDWVNLIYSLASLDPHEFDAPDEVDFDRRHNRHFAFGFGPHFCVGSHLAKLELQIALTEWMKRVPTIRFASGEAPKTHGGQVFGVDRLMLEW